MDIIFEIKKIRCSYDKQYKEGQSKVVLEIEELLIPRGKIIFIVGESGIGKSTILETLGVMNNTIVPNVQSKFVFYDTDNNGIDLCQLWKKGDAAISDFRLNNYSFIFQNTNLMRNFTAFENISFTRMLQGYTKYSCFQRTRKILKDLGLEHIDEKRMAQDLSGGQQQRLAFARAILPDFTILFGDEPTGNLDAENASRVMRILKNKLDENPETTAIIVSHDMHLASVFADVVVKIRKEIRPKKHPEDEDVIYGYCDNSCVYKKEGAVKFTWTNGAEKYSASDFETFLRNK